MNNDELLDELENLAQLDIDATFAYEQALKNIEDQTIHAKISKFRDDHVTHIDNLSEQLIKYGRVPPEKTKDFKGFLIEGFTSLRSMTGLLGALKAMKTNEELTNKKYQEAVENYTNAPADILDLLRRNYDDEKEHLSYIVSLLTKLDN